MTQRQWYFYFTFFQPTTINLWCYGCCVIVSCWPFDKAQTQLWHVHVHTCTCVHTHLIDMYDMSKQMYVSVCVCVCVYVCMCVCVCVQCTCNVDSWVFLGFVLMVGWGLWGSCLPYVVAKNLLTLDNLVMVGHVCLSSTHMHTLDFSVASNA